MTETWQERAKAILTQTEQPILIGPYRQELGTEILYWIPFVRKLLEQYKVDLRRVHVASRGGAGVYYGIPTGYELYRVRSLKEIRTANVLDFAQAKTLKQQQLTSFDAELISLIELEARQKFAILHPGLLYDALGDVWRERAPLGVLSDAMRFTKLPLPPLPAGLSLPEAFTVVRFYSRHTLPHTGQIAHWVRGTVRRLAARGPVVVLEPPDVTDDHYNFRSLDDKNIWHLGKELALDESLAVQGAIIGRAQRYVGTYGGMQQLALLLGVPSVGYYARFDGTMPIHLDVSGRLARALGVSWQVLKLDDEDHLRAVI